MFVTSFFTSRHIVFYIFLLVSLFSNAQDTVSVFFKSGKYKLGENQKRVIDAIPDSREMDGIDSVLFIGVADSTGSYASNKKLSEKRAMEVMNYCKVIFNPPIKSKISAIGERTANTDSLNRRVDILMYFKPFIPCLSKSLGGCYHVSYGLLHEAMVKNVKRNRKEYAMLIMDKRVTRKPPEGYFRAIDDNGQVGVEKIKWMSKTTGKLWWKESRYVAMIPLSDFKTFGIIVRVSDMVCDSCAVDIHNSKKPDNTDECLKLDKFLMYNIQVKRTLFNKDKIKVRAPREFVDLNARYFQGCTQERLNWKEGKGPFKKNYCYTKLSRNGNYLDNIVRAMVCCKYSRENSECNKEIIKVNCLSPRQKSLNLEVQAGSFYRVSEFTPYISLGLIRWKEKSQKALLLGTDQKLTIFGTAFYQYNFLSVPFSDLNPFKRWQSPGLLYSAEKYAQFYLGAEINGMLNSAAETRFRQNVHIGISRVNVHVNTRITRLFLQAGYALDYGKNYSVKPYILAQAGINFRII